MGKDQTDIPEFLTNHFSHLKLREYFFKHASILLGKNVLETWAEKINNNGAIILQYFKNLIALKKAEKSTAISIFDYLETLSHIEVHRVQNFSGSKCC